MEFVPVRKFGGELMQLLEVPVAKVRPNKFYYIRVRNKDLSGEVHGLRLDYIGKINVVDNDGISFDYIFYRKPGGKWKRMREETRILILREAFLKNDIEDNTTFYIAHRR